MTDLRDFVFFVATIVVVLSAAICSICAIKALQFYAEGRWERRRERRPLSTHVPLEPIRRSTYGPLDDIFAESELDRRRALREAARGPERNGC